MVTLGEMFGAGDVSTFMGLPSCSELAKASGPAVILGADGCTPYASVGSYCAGGPAAIRAAGATFAPSLAHMNFDLGRAMFPGALPQDAGDLPVGPDAAANRALIGTAVSDLLAAGVVPVLVGGDDSVQIPMLGAYQGRRIVILQIDAHIDWRDAVDGERLGLSSTMRRASETAHVKGIVQVGQRGIGSARPGDVAEARDWGVTFVDPQRLAAEGLSAALDAIPPGADVVICLDLDAFDPAIMPAVIGRTAGGLSYHQVLGLVEGVAARGRIAGFGMVEFMPARDVDGLGAMLAAQMLGAVLGLIAGQTA